MINGGHLLDMANVYLNDLFLSLAQKSEVPISTLTKRDNSVFTLQTVIESATVWVRW